jgi:UDP-N-acetylmuramoylalanine--D-glutamate ligase
MPSPTKNKLAAGAESAPAEIARYVAALPAPIALVGYGVEGAETLAFLLAQGATKLRVFDHAMDPGRAAALAGEFPGVEFYGEGDWTGPLSACGTVFRSPGVRPQLPAIQAALAAGARLTSASELFLALCPGRVVGVTGTVGKGTTVSLIGEALRAAGLPCRLGGNIGLNPLNFVTEMTAGEVAVLELSSFQLMELEGRLPEVAVVLRTSTEHLDWHTDVEEYRLAKGRLLAPAGAEQTVICCADSEGSREVAALREGDFLQVSLREAVRDGVGMAGGRFHRFRDGAAQPLPQLENLALPGRFNVENAAAAWLAAEALGAAQAPALAAIAAFPGLPHRLERVGRVNGVTCYNDSYATRPDASLAALSVFEEPLALIMGGSEKFADFAPLCEAVCRHPSLRRVVLIGATAERLAGELEAAAGRLALEKPNTLHADSLGAAFRAGLEALAAGGVLLFSPGCASFGMFPNYKVRGERFCKLVEAGGTGAGLADE